MSRAPTPKTPVGPSADALAAFYRQRSEALHRNTTTTEDAAMNQQQQQHNQTPAQQQQLSWWQQLMQALSGPK